MLTVFYNRVFTKIQKAKTKKEKKEILKKSIEKGYIGKKEFIPVVKKAYQGIIKKAKINSIGLVDIYDCSSIGIMDDYKMYVSQPKEVNTFAGVTSFILGTFSMEGLYK